MFYVFTAGVQSALPPEEMSAREELRRGMSETLVMSETCRVFIKRLLSE